MQLEGIIAAGQLVFLPFMQDNVAASQTNVQLNVVEVASAATLAVDEYVMPFAGSIVGLGWSLSAAGAAGVFTIGATIGGTENATTTQTVGTAARGSDKFNRDAVRFVAGDVLGVEITTDGSWDGTTSDLLVGLWVLVDLDGI